MDSEKEEPSSSTQDLEQQEEVIPGSSPEGVYHHPVQELFESAEPLQPGELKDGEQIVDQQPEGQIIVEDGEQQYMNMVQITPEDMYEAGFEFEDLNHLTEEQLNMVIAVSQQRQAKENQQGDVVNDGTHLIHHEMIHNEFEEDGAGGNEHGYEGEVGDGDSQIDDASMQIVITHEGGVNITDAKQHQFYLSPTEIVNLNIDLNNLSNEHVNQLLQIALPSMKEASEKNHEEPYNREVLDQAPSTSYHHHEQPEAQTDVSEQIKESLIGETVQIRTADGTLQQAVVKYYRGNAEFKIQLDNGQFAYAALDQLMHARIRNDHENYQEPVMAQREGNHIVAQKRGATSNDDLCPPVLKRSYQVAPVADGPHLDHSPNFCCPICDRKVFQKEPSYIVIRLPACDSCTREKIIVLDEQNS